MAGIYTIVNTGGRIYLTYSHFSCAIAILYLVVYSITLTTLLPCAHRLLLLTNYNLLGMVAMCHASVCAASGDMLDNNILNATQTSMYNRIRLRPANIEDRYVYGQYLGTDGKLHLGFDIAQVGGPPTGDVQPLPVERSRKRWLGPLRRRRFPEHRVTKSEEDETMLSTGGEGRGSDLEIQGMGRSRNCRTDTNE